MTHEMYWNLCACGEISPQAYHKWEGGERWSVESFEFDNRYWYRVRVESHECFRSFLISFVYPEMANAWFRKHLHSKRAPFPAKKD